MVTTGLLDGGQVKEPGYKLDLSYHPEQPRQDRGAPRPLAEPLVLQQL